MGPSDLVETGEVGNVLGVTATRSYGFAASQRPTRRTTLSGPKTFVNIFKIVLVLLSEIR